MRLETDEGIIEISAPNELRDQLARLDVLNNRAILSTADEQYIQTGTYDNGFVIEKRVGSEDQHFFARFRGGRQALLPSPSPTEKPKWWEKLLGFSRRPLIATHAFTQAEMMDVFEAFFTGAPDPEFIEWVSGYAN